MGAFGTDAPRPLWLCLAATLLLAALQVSAESKVDSDLVFDNLEQTDLTNHENHHRIARDSPFSEEDSLDSSPPVEEHWLSSTVNRIKRSIHNFLSTKSNSSHKRKHIRVPRQNSQEDAEEYDDEDDDDDVDYNEEDEDDFDGEYDEPENGDNNVSPNGDNIEGDDGYDVGIPPDEYTDENLPSEEENQTTTSTISTTTTIVTTTTESPDETLGPVEAESPVDRGDDGYDHEEPTGVEPAENGTRISEDDEDNLIDTSGERGSGEVPVVSFRPPLHPVYYRISFTVNEPYHDDFADRNSFKYRDFSSDIVREVDKLYEDVEGHQTANVILIEKRPADMFTSRVTIDLESVGFNNEEVIRRTMFDAIVALHRLGNIPVRPEDFQFRMFDARHVICDQNQLTCHNGQCVPSEARCNRTYECDDRSDEMGCDVFAPPSSPRPSTFAPPEGSGDVDFATTLTPSTDQCRGDLGVLCEDGSRSICEDQRCDGVRDCDDGGDERNCAPRDCGLGEISCDVTRCIPASSLCDGHQDCDDATDERGCDVCGEDQIKCDNKCIPSSKQCDGVSDCSDGKDEINCQSGKSTVLLQFCPSFAI